MDLTALGRGVVVTPGAPAPDVFASAERVVIDEEALAAPSHAVAVLHDHWASRRPVVVELGVSDDDLRTRRVDGREPWEVGHSFEFLSERLHFLVWANNWDARRGEPVWWWARKAARLGATAGGPEDIVLADGTPATVDGGPRGAISRGVIHRESVELDRLTPSRWDAPEGQLAPDQLAAVTHPSGAARIIAPAGSGKTRVLTERLRHLLGGCGWEPAAVTAVAFNKRAADELVARTAGLRTHVRTINALALAILTGSLGGPVPTRRPRVIDEYEVRRILDGLVDVRRQRNTDALAPFIEALSAIRIGLLSPQAAEAANPDAEGVVDVWPRYLAALDRAGAVDFDGQIDGAIRLMLTDPEVRAAVQRRCRHLLVDEFQDLAPAHLLLLRLAAAPGYDVFGVGDDDQVIYGYAGASPRYLIDFDAWFPAAGSHALEVNYRCPTTVVDGARHLLGYNHTRIDKAIRTPAATAPGALDVERVKSGAMATLAVTAVSRALADHRPDQIAVLTRVNSALLPVQIALGVAGIPTNCPVDRKVLERTGVRTALAWLRLGVDPGHITRADLTETIRRPSRRVARNVVEMLTKRSRSSVSEIRGLAGRLSGGDAEKLLGYAADIELVAAATRRDTAVALQAVRTRVGLATAMDSLDASRGEADRSSHGDDLRALEMVAALHPDAASFGDWLHDRLGGSQPAGQVVTLATVHRVKGQEWPIVVVFGAHDEAFPHRLAVDVEEERRVFHVAITRASERALILADADAASPFVAELDGSRPHTPIRSGARPAPLAPPAAGGPLDPTLWEALRSWRRDTASKAGVPAYVVMPDADLKGIAERKPATIEELRRCRGMGPTRLERYGDELLAVLEATVGP